MDSCCTLLMVVAGLETLALIGIAYVLYRINTMHSRQPW